MIKTKKEYPRIVALVFLLLAMLLMISVRSASADEVAATGIYLSQGSITVSIGGSAGLVATVMPDNANQDVAWFSSDSQIATAQNGCVFGVSAGNATITATTWGGGYSATCAVTVNPRVLVPTGVTLSDTSLSVPVNTTASLVASVQPDNATQDIIWSSDNPSVATVSIYGVQGVAPGVAHITATDDGCAATCTITVTSNDADLKSLTVSGGALNPSFDPATTSYTLTVSMDATSVDVTPVLADSTATVTVNNNVVTSGQAQTLNIANLSAVKIYVAASDGSNTKIYTLAISRASSLDAVASDSDLPADVQGYWAAAQIQSLLDKKIVSGYPDGSFKPDQPVTRAEFAAMLVNSLGLTPGANQVSFTDVSPGDWFYSAVETAAQNGIVKGSGGSFDPNAVISREQMAVMVDGALPIAKIKVVPASFEIYGFADHNAIDKWAVAGITDCISAGLMSGMTGDTLAPQADATRAQAAAMIYSLLDKAGKLTS